MIRKDGKYIQLEGRNFFRLKIAYSLLLKQSIIITNLQRTPSDYGLADYENSFLNLINEITNGTEIKFNATGDTLWFKPGTITNNQGKPINFNCDKSRCLSYYCEGLIPISLFGKERLIINITGITNNDIDSSVDSFKSSTCALLQKLVVGDKVVFNIKKRGLFPNGKGEIQFECPIITELYPFDWINEGRVKKISGMAFTSGLPNSHSQRMVNKSLGILRNLQTNIYISVDNYKSKDMSEISKGYGLSLTAETTKGFFFSSDEINQTDVTDEQLAEQCAKKFMKEIMSSGVVNANNQGLFLFLMALANNISVSKMKIGKITKHTKGVMQLIDKLLGIKFKITEVDDYDQQNEEEEDDDKDNAEEEEEEKDDEDDNNEDGDDNKEDEEDIPHDSEKQFMFSCIGRSFKSGDRVQI